MGRCFSDRAAQLHSISLNIFTFSEQDLLIWLCPVLIVAHRVFVASRGIFRRGPWAPEHVGFSNCGVKAWFLSGMWDLGSLTRDPICVSTWQGRFLTTGPLGKSLHYFLPVSQGLSLSMWNDNRWAATHGCHMITCNNQIDKSLQEMKARSSSSWPSDWRLQGLTQGLAKVKRGSLNIKKCPNWVKQKL